jgi:hypothetical protein
VGHEAIIHTTTPVIASADKKFKQEEMTGKDAFTITLKGNIGTTVVIARNEAIAQTALYLRFIGDCFVPRNDGLNAGFRGSFVIGRHEVTADTTTAGIGRLEVTIHTL